MQSAEDAIGKAVDLGRRVSGPGCEEGRQAAMLAGEVNIRRTLSADLVRIRASLRVLFCTILHGRDSRNARFTGAAGKG
jgi:hypothetical protein